MERMIKGYEGVECVNSDLSVTVYGGAGFWTKIIRFLADNIDQFLLGFVEGWTGEDIISPVADN